jgi:hypothetical protein
MAVLTAIFEALSPDHKRLKELPDELSRHLVNEAAALVEALTQMLHTERRLDQRLQSTRCLRDSVIVAAVMIASSLSSRNSSMSPAQSPLRYR